MAKENLVTAGAQISCSIGSAPSTFNIVDPNRKAVAVGSKIGTVNDKDLPNIGTFGTCPNLGPGPCAPVIALPWSPGSTKCLVGGSFALKEGDQLICSVGGVIGVDNANQDKVVGE